ncbi:hypothetical protein Bca4012_093656 [Brassica carinata]
MMIESMKHGDVCLGAVPVPETFRGQILHGDITGTAWGRECWREDELLSRYTDYFAKALSGVAFPWVKMFNESPNLSTLIDVSLSHIPQSIYGTTRNWMNMPPVEVGMFVALAIVLHCKPEALTSVLPTLREDPKYQGHDKLPLTVWMIAQAAKGGELDLKPENFLLLNEDENSPLKTIDFGLSDFYKPGDGFKDIVSDAYYMALEALKRKYESEAVI